MGKFKGTNLMADIEINLTDRSDEAEEIFMRGLEYAGTVIGMKAETYAKLQTPVDTGRLRNSMNNRYVDSEKTVYVGTNVEYAPHIEWGHHSYAGKHMLKNSIAEHLDEYKQDIASALQKASE